MFPVVARRALRAVAQAPQHRSMGTSLAMPAAWAPAPALSNLRSWLRGVSATAGVLPTASAAQPWFGELVENVTKWWNGVLQAAVPKKRRSLARRRVRHTSQAHKRFQPRQNLSTCEACGGPRLLHHVCPACLQKAVTATKATRRPAHTIETKTGDAN